MLEEDKKDAIKISFNLSNQLMAAALAMITILFAFCTYILSNLVPTFWFYVFASITFFLFVSSIFLGGKGISKAYNEGYKGKWDVETGKKHFNYQALICLIALCFFVITLLFSGPTKKMNLQEKISELKNNIQNLGAKYEDINDHLNTTQCEIIMIRKKLDSLDEKLNKETDKRKLVK